jgi:hypothetical protein
MCNKVQSLFFRLPYTLYVILALRTGHTVMVRFSDIDSGTCSGYMDPVPVISPPFHFAQYPELGSYTTALHYIIPSPTKYLTRPQALRRATKRFKPFPVESGKVIRDAKAVSLSRTRLATEQNPHGPSSPLSRPPQASF